MCEIPTVNVWIIPFYLSAKSRAADKADMTLLLLEFGLKFKINLDDDATIISNLEFDCIIFVEFMVQNVSVPKICLQNPWK